MGRSQVIDRPQMALDVLTTALVEMPEHPVVVDLFTLRADSDADILGRYWSAICAYGASSEPMTAEALLPHLDRQRLQWLKASQDRSGGIRGTGRTEHPASQRTTVGVRGDLIGQDLQSRMPNQGSKLDPELRVHGTIGPAQRPDQYGRLNDWIRAMHETARYARANRQKRRKRRAHSGRRHKTGTYSAR